MESQNAGLRIDRDGLVDMFDGRREIAARADNDTQKGVRIGVLRVVFQMCAVKPFGFAYIPGLMRGDSVGQTIFA
jgi:hypothetical protein